MTKTIEALQSGKSRFKWVVLIEGLSGWVGSDASQDAIDDLTSGTDWDGATRVECFVDLTSEQKLTLWDPWPHSGRATIRFYDPSDALPRFLNKRLSGAQTELTVAADRNDTTLTVASTTGFPSSGTAYIGTETIIYGGITGSSFTSVTRGVASPFGCDSSGSGGDNFGNHHRIAVDSNHTQASTLITQLPRVHVGRRVGVWMHTVDSDGALNSKADAQLVFAGRIASIADDFHTVLDLEHVYDTDIKTATLGRDLFAAKIPEGLQLREDRRFEFADFKVTGGAATVLVANPLIVVSGTPASVNEIQQGWYSAGEICDRLNAWLGSELNAGRIYGHYSWASPVSSNVGLRTKCYWKIEHGSKVPAGWEIKMSGEAAAFLGLTDTSGDLRGQQVPFGVESSKAQLAADNPRIKEGKAVPYRSMMFYARGPGSHAQEFGGAIQYSVENPSGIFYNQFDLMPAAVKGSLDSSLDWGIFLFDERVLVVGAYDASDPTEPLLKNCYVAPFQFASTSSGESLMYVGRRLDETEQGAVAVRQILVLEQNWAQLLLRIAYSTGTSGYNHSTYDSLPYGCGWNIPGSLLGPEFERSLLNLPGADMPAVVVIDEATTFADLFRDDFIFRWSFLRWRDQGFEVAEWRTPIASAVAKSYAGTSLALIEANKADAAPNADHRIASIESNDFIRPVVRINFARGFGTQDNANYTRRYKVEDQRAVDDTGGGVKAQVINLRHTFAELAATGAAVDKLLPGFISRMPMASKAARKIVRTVDLRYYEGYGVGDIALVTDSYARDPITGARGISARPAMISRITYSPGGPAYNGGKPRDMYGEMELLFLDVQRGSDYAPCAEVDEGEANAGYDAGTRTFTYYPHAYSHDLAALGLRRGGTTSDTEDLDAENFYAGLPILIVEMDPADPANPTMWQRAVESQTGNTVKVTVALSAPAWDATKKYRIVPDIRGGDSTDRGFVWQADDATFLIESDDPPYDFSQGGKGLSFTQMAGTELAEFIPDVAYGDGRPYDVGIEHAIARTLNAWHDGKSLHQSPSMNTSSLVAGSIAATDWELMYIRPLFLGTEHLTSTIRRVLTVAPRFKSNSGASVSVRVSIGRVMPTEAPGIDTGYGTGYQNPSFASEYSQTTSWTTSSTTEALGADKTLEINCKDIHFGYVYLVIESKGDALVRGLAKCREGAREVG